MVDGKMADTVSLERPRRRGLRIQLEHTEAGSSLSQRQKHENLRKGSDEHWTALSDVAEEILCKGTGQPRSEGWEPRRRSTMLKMRRLLRVKRRACHLDSARLDGPRRDALKDALNEDMVSITKNAQAASWTLEEQLQWLGEDVAAQANRDAQGSLAL